MHQSACVRFKLTLGQEKACDLALVRIPCPLDGSPANDVPFKIWGAKIPRSTMRDKSDKNPARSKCWSQGGLVCDVGQIGSSEARHGHLTCRRGEEISRKLVPEQPAIIYILSRQWGQ